MFAKGLKQLLAGLTALCLLAGPALSEVHTIVIMDFAYFPPITYVQAGDTINFTNESGIAHTVVSKDTSWGIGPIANGGIGSILVSAAMQSSYYSAGELGKATVENPDALETDKERLLEKLNSGIITLEDIALIPRPQLNQVIPEAQMVGTLNFNPAPLD